MSMVYRNEKCSVSGFIAATFTIILFGLHVTHAFIYNPTKDANGCISGEEFRGGSCRPCLPGTWRFVLPTPYVNPSRRNLKRRSTISLATFQEMGVREAVDAKPFSQNVNARFSIDIDQDGSIPTTPPRCQPCREGTAFEFYGGVHPEVCRECPVNQYTNNGKRCKNCPYPLTSNYKGTACQPCPYGTFLLPKFLQRAERRCAPCPEGFGTRSVGSPSKASCKPCTSPGVRCPCPPTKLSFAFDQRPTFSHFRLNGSGPCIRCPIGTVADDEFATKESDCKKCPEGQRWNFGICEKCGANLVANGTDCLKPTSKTCEHGGVVNPDGVCERCTVGFILVGNKCVRCPPRYVSNNDPKCRKCKDGVMVQPNGASCGCSPGERAIYTRIGNSFMLEISKCVKCPFGYKTYDVRNGVHREPNCVPDCEKFPWLPSCCAQGERYYYGGCKKCHPRTVQLNEMGSCRIPQTGCEAGEELEIIEKWGILFSFKCRGRRCTATDNAYFADWKCKPCPPGRFLSSTESGTPICKGCSGDSISMGLRLSCTKCEDGLQRDKENPDICSCRGDAFAGKGVSKDGLRCEACAAGTYANASMVTCAPCMPGSFAFNTGKGSCVLCPPGKYAPKGGLRTCWKCPEGTIGNRGADNRGSSKCIKANASTM